MTTASLRFTLLVFAALGFAGGGAALAVARQRLLEAGERDRGMLSVGAILVGFGVLCAWVGGGVAAVPGFGGVVVWAAYVLTARRLGLFEVNVGLPRVAALERSHGGR